MADVLHAEGIPPRAVYRPGEVCQLAEHPEVSGTDPRALASFLIGSHHRVSHVALVEWLERNQKFQREGV